MKPLELDFRKESTSSTTWFIEFWTFACVSLCCNSLSLGWIPLGARFCHKPWTSLSWKTKWFAPILLQRNWGWQVKLPCAVGISLLGIMIGWESRCSRILVLWLLHNTNALKYIILHTSLVNRCIIMLKFTWFL